MCPVEDDSRRSRTTRRSSRVTQVARSHKRVPLDHRLRDESPSMTEYVAAHGRSQISVDQTDGNWPWVGVPKTCLDDVRLRLASVLNQPRSRPSPSNHDPTPRLVDRKPVTPNLNKEAPPKSRRDTPPPEDRLDFGLPIGATLRELLVRRQQRQVSTQFRARSTPVLFAKTFGTFPREFPPLTQSMGRLTSAGASQT